MKEIRKQHVKVHQEIKGIRKENQELMQELQKNINQKEIENLKGREKGWLEENLGTEVRNFFTQEL